MVLPTPSTHRFSLAGLARVSNLLALPRLSLNVKAHSPVAAAFANLKFLLLDSLAVISPLFTSGIPATSRHSTFDSFQQSQGAEPSLVYLQILLCCLAAPHYTRKSDNAWPLYFITLWLLNLEVSRGFCRSGRKFVIIFLLIEFCWYQSHLLFTLSHMSATFGIFSAHCAGLILIVAPVDEGLQFLSPRLGVRLPSGLAGHWIVVALGCHSATLAINQDRIHSSHCQFTEV